MSSQSSTPAQPAREQSCHERPSDERPPDERDAGGRSARGRDRHGRDLPEQVPPGREHHEPQHREEAEPQRHGGPGGGAVVVVGTPIGNLSDASQRLRDILATADVLAVEDTRTLHRLATGLGVSVSGKILTHHEHNENHRAGELLDEVRQGRTVAVLSDAGMPTVSDPGFPLVRAAAEAELPVTVLPGPSAVLAALAVSGLPTDRFTFEGFLPRKSGERAAQLATLTAEPRTMVFYESPHRLGEMLTALRDALGGDRRAVVCRELTKLHEEVLRDELAGLAAWATGNQVRGEIVVVVHGAAPAPAPEPEDLVGEVEALVASHEIKLKAAARQIATERGVSTRRLYDAVIASRARD